MSKRNEAQGCLDVKILFPGRVRFIVKMSNIVKEHLFFFGYSVLTMAKWIIVYLVVVNSIPGSGSTEMSHTLI